MAQTRQQVLDRIGTCGNMSYAEWIQFLNSVAFLTDIVGGGSLSASLKTVIQGGDILVIDWFNDTVDFSAVTYYAKHGGFPMIAEENKGDDNQWTPNAAPAYSWNAGRTILTLSPQTPNTNFIIL